MELAVAMEGVMDCSVDGCHNQAAPKRRGYCYAHYKRAWLGKPVNVELRERRKSPRGSWGYMMEAFYRLVDLKNSDSDGYRDALQNLRTAIYLYYQAEHQPNQHTKGRRECRTRRRRS